MSVVTCVGRLVSPGTATLGRVAAEGAYVYKRWKPINDHRMETVTEAGIGRERGRVRGWRTVDKHKMGAGTGMGVETHRRSQDGNGDGSGDGVGTGTGVETRRRTQDRSGDGNGGGDP